MKRNKLTAIIISICLAAMCAGLLAGCGAKNGGSDAKLEGTLDEIINKIYENKQPDIPLATTEIDLSDANQLKYYTGLDSADGISAAAASEAMIGSQAYSLVLVRVSDSKSLKTTAQAMKDGIDTRKWICVEADDMQVVGYGDVAVLAMVDSGLSDVVTSQQLADAFKTVCGGTLSVELK